MKKYMRILICILVCVMSACSPYDRADNISAGKTDYDEIIDSGKYYCIYKGNSTQVYYNIYDKNGALVLSKQTNRPLKINMLKDDVIDIEIGMGTGVAIHKYYDAAEGVFSQEFCYVLSNSDELVAYIDVPKEKYPKDRKVIVQNIFDENEFYKEFSLDFSDVDIPVIKAEFSTDGTSLQLTYLRGKEQTQITTNLGLQRTGDGLGTRVEDRGRFA